MSAVALVRNDFQKVVGTITEAQITNAYNHHFRGNAFFSHAWPDDGAIKLAFDYANYNPFRSAQMMAASMKQIIDVIDFGKGCVLAGAGTYGDWDGFDANKGFYITFNTQAAHDAARSRNLPLEAAAELVITAKRVQGAAMLHDAAYIGVAKTKKWVSLNNSLPALVLSE